MFLFCPFGIGSLRSQIRHRSHRPSGVATIGILRQLAICPFGVGSLRSPIPRHSPRPSGIATIGFQYFTLSHTKQRLNTLNKQNIEC